MTKRFIIRLEKILFDRIQKMAKRFSISDSDYMRIAIIEKLERDENN